MGGIKVLSTKVDVTTTGATGFALPQVTATATADTSVTLSATAIANVAVKCGAFADGATAPTADQVYANTGTGNAAVAATNGPVVAVVEGTAAGAGIAITGIAISGLTASTAYDIYCATNDGAKVLSTKVDITTTATPTSLTWTSAATSSSMVSGAAPGNLVFTLGITTALANTDTLDITASQAIWSAVAASTCTATIGGTATTAFTTAATSTTVLRLTASGDIAAGAFVLTCTDNIAVNGAAGAVTFDIVSTKDTTALTGQTGYTITAAPTTTTTVAPTTAPTTAPTANTTTAAAAAAAAKKDDLSVASQVSTSIVALFGTMFALFLANL